MKKQISIYFFIMALLHAATAADYPKKPVTTLRYETNYGVEEDEDLNELISDSIRHSILLRIKEEINKDFYFNLPVKLTYKDYYADDFYYYLQFDPYFSLNINSRLNLKMYFLAKWMDYNLADRYGLTKDFYNLNTKCLVTYKMLENLKLSSYIKTDYDIYLNEEKRQQTYTAQLKAESKINLFKLSGTYTAKVYLPLTDASTKSTDFLNTFVLNLEYDPNE